MRRLLTAALAAWLLAPSTALAQVDGFFIPYAGFSTGGDTTREGGSFGVALAVMGRRLGVEVDLGHTMDFNHVLFEQSGVTTLMANFAASGSGRIRPYGLAGVGMIRVRGCDTAACARAVSRTDIGFDAAGGVAYFFNEVVGLRADLRYFRFLQHHPDLPRTSGGFFDLWRFTLGASIGWPIDP